MISARQSLGQGLKAHCNLKLLSSGICSSACVIRQRECWAFDKPDSDPSWALCHDTETRNTYSHLSCGKKKKIIYMKIERSSEWADKILSWAKKNKDGEKVNKAERWANMCVCVCERVRPCISVCYQLRVCLVFLALTYQSGPAGREQSSVGRRGVS